MPGIDRGIKINGRVGIIDNSVRLTDDRSGAGDKLQLDGGEREVEVHNLILGDGGKNNIGLIVAGGLGGGGIDFVGNSGGVIIGRGVLLHDNLRSFGERGVGKLTEVRVIGKEIGGANAGNGLAVVNADSVEAKAVGVVLGPGGGDRFRTGSGVAGGVGDGVAD